MAWDDLYADATVYFPLNGNATPILNNALAPNLAVTGGTTGNARAYENDVPPGCTYTQSYRVNGYTTAPQEFSIAYAAGMPLLQNSPTYNKEWLGQTVSFWIKIDSSANPLNLGSLIRIFEHDVPGATPNETMSLFNGGANFNDPSGNVGKLRWVNMHYVSSASNLIIHPDGEPNMRMQPNRWYHIVCVWAEYRNNNTTIGANNFYDGERAIFVNGEVVHNRYISNVATFVQRTGPLLALYSNTGSLSQSVQKMSSYAFWNRPLSYAEIKNLYFANMPSTSDYSQVVMSDNPSYYVKFNNANKATPVDIDGSEAATWGPIEDEGSNIDVNQESKFGKSWLIKHSGTTAAENVYNVADGKTAMAAGIGPILRNLEYSYEYWFRSSTLPSGTRNTWGITSNSTYIANANYHIVNLSFNSGTIGAQYVRRTGTSAFSGQTITPLINTSTLHGTATSTIQYNVSNSPSRWHDGNWHHVVLTASKTESSTSAPGTILRYRLYIDGIHYNTVTQLTDIAFTENGVPLPLWLFGSNNASSTVNRDFFIDKLAIYPRKLEQHKVMDHYLAGATFLQSQAGGVKYWDGDSWNDSSAQKVWNGTAWIDWDHRYWNGTQWISL